MEVSITTPQIGIVSTTGSSLWENEDGVHIKPKGESTVKAEYIDELPLTDEDGVHLKPIDGYTIKAEYIDGLLWEDEDGTHIKPTDSKLVNVENIDFNSNALKKVPIFSIGGILEVGSKFSIPIPFDMTVESVFIAVGTAPTGASLIVDINKNGSTIYTTQANRPAITSGNTSAIPSLPDIVSISSNDILQVEVDQIGSTIPGSDLMIYLICTL